VGPCIAVGEADPTNIDTETFVNGEHRQRFNTATGAELDAAVAENVERREVVCVKFSKLGIVSERG
jgi:hypothetical protein